MLRLVLVFLILGATASWSQQDMRLAILGNGDLDRLNIVTTVASNAGLGFISADAQWSCPKQSNDAEGAISQGATAAIIMPVCAENLSAIIDSFRNAGMSGVVILGGVSESDAQVLLDQASGMRLHILGAGRDSIPTMSELNAIASKVSEELSLGDGLLQPDWSCTAEQSSPVQVCWDGAWDQFAAVSMSAVNLLVSNFNDGSSTVSTPYGDLTGNGVLTAQPVIMFDEDQLASIGSWDSDRRDELLQRLFAEICPSCTVTEKVCSKNGCPQRCSQCTTDGDSKCCTKSGMDPP